VPRRSWCPSVPTTSSRSSSGSPACAVPGCREVPQRGDKKALMRPSSATPRRRSPSTSCVEPATSRRAPRPCRAAGRARPGHRAAADRVHDISHIQGSDVVASLAVFEDARPQVRVRRFVVKEAPRGDSPRSPRWCGAASPYLNETNGDGRSPALIPRRAAAQFAYAPNLLVVDGAARRQRRRRCARRAGVSDVAVIAWPSGWRRSGCRRSRAVHPAEDQRGPLPAATGADEAHRFAISFHGSGAPSG